MRISKKFSLIAAAFTLLTTSSLSQVAKAETCNLTSATQNLHLVYPAKSLLRNPVDVTFTLDHNLLKAHFNVRTKQINAKDPLAANEYPYQHDVVELFVSVAGPQGDHMPYYEFEVSPKDQSFQVKILDLKKPFQDNVQMGLEHAAHRTPTGWSADLNIPLENLNWDGRASQIIGNAYAIQGTSPNRSYCGLTLPTEVKPNFHKPQFFKPLFSCQE